MGLTKAWITNEDSNDRIECMFNPSEYTVAKTNQWKQTRVVGKNVPMLTFTGGESRSLTLQLFFDVYEQGGDVRTHVDKLWKLAMIDEHNQNRETHQARPPFCTFHWGPNWSFDAAITNLSVRYTLFREDGTPVRATASVTFQEGKDDAAVPQTHATQLSEFNGRIREVSTKDTLPLISHQEYGDATLWRTIADANNMTDPNELKPGQLLKIPPKPHKR